MFKLFGNGGMLFLTVVISVTYLYIAFKIPDPLAPDGISINTIASSVGAFTAFILASIILWVAGIWGYPIIIISFPLVISRIVKNMNSQGNPYNQ